MALDYSQIELRAVAELISDWFGTDSILRQSFAAGVDAHIATAMKMTGKDKPAGCHRRRKATGKAVQFRTAVQDGRQWLLQLSARQLCPGHYL